MKAVWMMHDVVLTDEIQDLLDEMGIVGLSRWKRMTGRGPKSGARMDNHVWPGANSGAFVVVEDDVAARLMGRDQLGRDFFARGAEESVERVRRVETLR